MMTDVSKYTLFNLALSKAQTAIQKSYTKSSKKNMGKQSRLLAFVLAILIGAVYLIVSHPPKLGLDLRGGAQLTLQAKINPEQGINEITPRIMETAKGLGVSEATILLAGNDQLIVQLPGVNDPAQAERVIGTTAQLDFRKQKKGTESELRARLQIQQAAAIQREVLKNSTDQKAIAENEAAYKKSIEDLKGIFERTGLTGNMLKDAVASPTGNGPDSWQVALTFDDKGGDLFAKTTSEIGGTGRALGIFLDDKLISSPSVGPEFQGKGITGGRAVITGNFNLDTANELALQLRAAGVAGLLLVLIFMVIYYRILGVVADIALITYAVITFASFSLLGVVLTLPGIAGFILSIGMAVDANVLIFERTKEELKAGRTLYKSVEAGFYRAWSSILDSNVTTLIACGTLFWLGSGFVKGFAVTLGVGVLTSMFTAVTLSRSLMLAMISNPNFRKPEYYGMKAFGKISTTIDIEVIAEENASDKKNDNTSGAVL